MRHKPMSALWTLVAAISLPGCAANSSPPPPEVIRLPPIETIRNIFPVIPSDMLNCLDESIVPEELTKEGARDNQAAAFGEANRIAGADCRAKLGQVRALVATWPRN